MTAGRRPALLADRPEIEGRAPAPNLGTGLKPRHITMISIAGVIGAGLFVGSVTAIRIAGPAVIIAYAMAGCWSSW